MFHSLAHAALSSFSTRVEKGVLVPMQANWTPNLSKTRMIPILPIRQIQISKILEIRWEGLIEGPQCRWTCRIHVADDMKRSRKNDAVARKERHGARREPRVIRYTLPICL